MLDFSLGIKIERPQGCKAAEFPIRGTRYLFWGFVGLVCPTGFHFLGHEYYLGELGQYWAPLEEIAKCEEDIYHI